MSKFKWTFPALFPAVSTEQRTKESNLNNFICSLQPERRGITVEWIQRCIGRQIEKILQFDCFLHFIPNAKKYPERKISKKPIVVVLFCRYPKRAGDITPRDDNAFKSLAYPDFCFFHGDVLRVCRSVFLL